LTCGDDRICAAPVKHLGGCIFFLIMFKNASDLWTQVLPFI
jgi:hypothetical protein